MPSVSPPENPNIMSFIQDHAFYLRWLVSIDYSIDFCSVPQGHSWAVKERDGEQNR